MQLNYLRQQKFKLFNRKETQKITRKDIAKWCFNAVVWLLMATLTYLAIEVMQRGGASEARALYEVRPQVFLGNYLIVLLITSPALLFKRTHFVAMILCGISGILCCVSDIVLKFRGVPLIWSDVYTIGEGISIANQYIDKKMALVILGALVVLVVVLVVAFFIRFKVYGIHPIIRIVLWGVLASGLFIGTKSIVEMPGVFEPIPWDVRLSYERNGFVYSFVDSYLATFRKAPEGYSKQLIGDIKDQLAQDQVMAIDTPNIIMIQLEGIMDPYILEGLSYSEDALANFRQCGQMQAGGMMQVPTLGGGTVRTEFEMLTSMDIDQLSPGEIPYNSGVLKKGAVESLAHALKDSGYRTTAIHNFQGNFYSRQDAFASLGFDTFIPMEAMKGLDKIAGVWPKDHVILDYIDKSIQSSEGQDFIYAITVGSHGPYNEGPIPENTIEIQGDLSESAKKELSIYLQRIKEVDKFVGNLMEYVNNLDEHTVLVMFSDHYPSMEVVEGVSAEDKFLVPYVVMDNKQNVKGKFPAQLEAYELSTYVLDVYGLQGGVMNSYQRSYREDANYKAYMNSVQYDMLFGQKHMTEGDNPYKTTTIQIGLNELEIDRINQQADKLIIKGDGFNQSSQIFVDDQAVETKFIDGQTLESVGKVPENYEGVRIKQLGRNKISLLDSNEFLTRNE